VETEGGDFEAVETDELALAGMHLLDDAIPHHLAEAPALREPLQDVTLRRESEEALLLVREEEERARVRREHQAVDVVEECRDRGRARELAEREPRALGRIP